MNLFSLHGKWYENNENRLTSNVLYFLDEFREEILKGFITKYIPRIPSNHRELKSSRITFQVYDLGKIPDAEIIIGNTRILLESKVGTNLIHESQLKEYCIRLMNTRIQYPETYLFVVTQTNQRARTTDIAKSIASSTGFDPSRVIYIQWKEILELFELTQRSSRNKVLIKLLSMFSEEVRNTMYSKYEIPSMPVSLLNEIVLTSQTSSYLPMALEDHVFWPYARFSPAQYVAYYFTENCGAYSKQISHIAQINYIFHDVTIDEVLTDISEFQLLSDFARFKQRAIQIYPPGDPRLFTIGITMEPIKLKHSIPYVHQKGGKLKPNILPGRQTTLAKLIQANTLEDLV